MKQIIYQIMYGYMRDDMEKRVYASTQPQIIDNLKMLRWKISVNYFTNEISRNFHKKVCK